MLPADRRMRRSDEFARTVRSGRRVGSRTVVVHLYEPADSAVGPAPVSTHTPSRIGFVVGRGVGGSVVRSRVTRRLRHVMRSRLDAVPEGALVVVRALGPAASASSATLASAIDHALGRLIPADGSTTAGSVAISTAGAR